MDAADEGVHFLMTDEKTGGGRVGGNVSSVGDFVGGNQISTTYLDRFDTDEVVRSLHVALVGNPLSDHEGAIAKISRIERQLSVVAKDLDVVARDQVKASSARITLDQKIDRNHDDTDRKFREQSHQIQEQSHQIQEQGDQVQRLHWFVPLLSAGLFVHFLLLIYVLYQISRLTQTLIDAGVIS